MHSFLLYELLSYIDFLCSRKLEIRQPPIEDMIAESTHVVADLKNSSASFCSMSAMQGVMVSIATE